MSHRPSPAGLPRSLRVCGRRHQDVLTRLCECGLGRSLEFINGCKIGHHYAKRFGLINTAENLPADFLQLIGNFVGQREDERSVDTLKWNVQPRAVVEPNKLRLRGPGLEIHDDVFSEGVLSPDFEHGEKLVEMALGEFGIDSEPDLSPLLCGSNDSALRSGCRLLGRGHLPSLS